MFLMSRIYIRFRFTCDPANCFDFEDFDEDESDLCYEWQNIPANYNPLHTLLPQIHMPAFDPSIRVALHMGDESWFELAPSIDTEFDFGHSYDLDVAKFLKLLDTCVNFT